MHASSSWVGTTDFGKLIPYSVVIADPGVPPPNGHEVLRFLDSALLSLSATDLGFTEFCCLCPTADSDRISVLRKIHTDKLNAKTASSAPDSASDDTSGITVNAEGNEVKSDLSPPTKPTSGSLGAQLPMLLQIALLM